MSNIEGPLVVETIEQQQQILDRTSVEPDSFYDNESAVETDSLLGISKNAYPKRVMMLFGVMCLYLLSALSTAATNLDLYYNYVCSHFGVDRDMCMRDESSNRTVADFIGINTSIVAAFSLVVTSLLSVASDRIGRKPFFIYAMGINCLAILAAWFIYFRMSTKPTYWVMLIPSIIDGIGGGAHLVELLCIPYISDMVPDAKNRARLLAFSTGCLLASITIGPMTASWIVEKWGLEQLYICAAIGVGSSAILTSLFLRESLSPFHKRRNSESDLSLHRTFISVITFSGLRDKRVRRNARVLLVCTLVVAEYNSSFWPVLILYPKLRFGWTAIESGYLLSAMFGTRTFWFLLGFPFIYKLVSRWYTVYSNRMDNVDRTLMMIGLTIGVFGSLALGWSQTSEEYFASGVLDACASLGSPIFISALIKHIPSTQVGSFMAAFNIVLSVMTILIPSLVMHMYSVTIQWRPSITFEITAAVFATVVVAIASLRLD